MMINKSGCCINRVIFTKNLEFGKTKQIEIEIEFSMNLRKIIKASLKACLEDFKLNFNVFF